MQCDYFSLYYSYNPHFQISIESQTKRLNFEPFGKTKCSKIDKHTAQKNVEKTRFFETVVDRFSQSRKTANLYDKNNLYT